MRANSVTLAAVVGSGKRDVVFEWPRRMVEASSALPWENEVSIRRIRQVYDRYATARSHLPRAGPNRDRRRFVVGYIDLIEFGEGHLRRRMGRC